MKIANFFIAVVGSSSVILAGFPVQKTSALATTDLTVTIQPLNCIVDVVNDGIKLITSTTSKDCRRALSLAGY